MQYFCAEKRCSDQVQHICTTSKISMIMAKRIEFLAPVEAMRGNLSRTKQHLLYADNNNPGWDAPEGKRSYARNYEPIFVGAKRAKDGKKYFQIKTKTAVTISPKVKTNMALLGASAELANVITADLRIFPDLQDLYVQNHPEGWSFKRWMMKYIREGLSTFSALAFPSAGPLAAKFVKNPYISTTQPSGAVDVSEYYPTDLLVKFWPQLANNPITFKVGDLTGVANDGDTWSDLIGSSYNVLGVTVDESENLLIDNKYLQYIDDSTTTPQWEYCPLGDAIEGEGSSVRYRLTDVQP